MGQEQGNMEDSGKYKKNYDIFLPLGGVALEVQGKMEDSKKVQKYLCFCH
jgi:hypothetical protein